MKGVTFGTYHSYDTFGLILSKKEIESPKPKLETVNVPGADGILDMTDYFGDVKYENRKLKFDFSTALRGSELLSLYSDVQDALGGRYFDSIVIDDDSDYRYIGRVTSVKLTESAVSKLTVECSCEPYKVRVLNTVVSIPLNALPYGEGYGDCNSDGVTNDLDAVYLLALIENNSATVSDYASCDLNFDGTIDNNDVSFLTGFLSQSEYSSIKDYAEAQWIYRDTETVIDFGRNPVEAYISIDFSGGSVNVWEMYVDGALWLKSTTNKAQTVISGSHRVMFRTPRTGNVTIDYSESRL